MGDDSGLFCTSPGENPGILFAQHCKIYLMDTLCRENKSHNDYNCEN